MSLSSKNAKIKKIDNFVRSLFYMKDNISSGLFENYLDSLHCSFCTLLDIFSTQSVSQKLEIEITKEYDTNKIQVGEISLLLHDDVVIDIGENFKELAFIFVGKHKDFAKQLCELYSDYKTRNCDRCGQYFVRYTCETPMIRIVKNNKVNAYHTQCVEL